MGPKDGLKRLFIEQMDEQSLDIFKSDKKIKKFDKDISTLENIKSKKFPTRASASIITPATTGTTATPSTTRTPSTTTTKPTLTKEEQKITNKLKTPQHFENKIDKVKAKKMQYENEMIEDLAAKEGVKTMLKPIHDTAVKQMETFKILKDKGIDKVVVINKVEFLKIIKKLPSPDKIKLKQQYVELDI